MELALAGRSARQVQRHVFDGGASVTVLVDEEMLDAAALRAGVVG